MKVLITGITGFVGSHLADYLLEKVGIEVCGIARWRSQKENIRHLEDKIQLFECDIKDMTSVHEVVKSVKPERIFHLAAQSFVPVSWSAPTETLSTNIIGEINIFESVRDVELDTVIHLAGSSEEYGLVRPDEVPINEDNPLRPLSPYGVSKVAQDLLGYQYFKSYGMRIVRTRAFNHTGPRRGEVFVCSNFAKQIAEIEKGNKEAVMLVGNLEAQRDFTDVRDIVKAYWLSTEKCDPGEVYNICSGEPRTIQSMLDTLLSFTDVKVEVKKDPSRMRPSDVPILKGDCTKFREKTGWKPE
ncbi:MAG: SDR family oxidoreductase, partial [Candidatus Cloacimonadota bacterium]